MAEPSNEDAAKALDRLTSPQGPTPQPKPRPALVTRPLPKAPINRPAAPAVKAPSSGARAAVHKSPPAPKATPQVDLQQALAGAQSAPGLRKAPRAKSDPAATQLALQRTAIPILLTLGFILVALVAVHFAWQSDENPVLELPGGVVVALAAGGAILWGLAAVNILSVRRRLTGRTEPR